jgi:hypothetical protein
MRCLIFAALFLTGCGARGVEVRTVTVPVPQPCLPRDQIPDEPETVGHKLIGDAAIDIVTITESALQLRAVVKETRAALIACAG